VYSATDAAASRKANPIAFRDLVLIGSTYMELAFCLSVRIMFPILCFEPSPRVRNAISE
jgi:hypothetical protein